MTKLQLFMPGGKTPRCQKRVHTGAWARSGQCERRATVKDVWCWQHDPEAEKKRKDNTTARHNKEWAERRFEIHGKKFHDVLQRIANGNNEPRGLAINTLREFDK